MANSSLPTVPAVEAMHDRYVAALADCRVVHIHKGRNQHLTSDRPWLTVCGKPWVAAVIGPPASEAPLCRRCFGQEG